MPYVVSTLARPNRYAHWENIAGIGSIAKEVLVNGGAGVASNSPGNQIYTPDGVRTEVSKADAEFLSNHPVFQEHQKRGFVKIIASAKDPDTVAQGMESKDASKPKTPSDVENFQKKGGDTITAVTNRKRA